MRDLLFSFQLALGIWLPTHISLPLAWLPKAEAAKGDHGSADVHLRVRTSAGQGYVWHRIVVSETYSVCKADVMCSRAYFRTRNQKEAPDWALEMMRKIPCSIESLTLNQASVAGSMLLIAKDMQASPCVSCARPCRLGAMCEEFAHDDGFHVHPAAVLGTCKKLDAAGAACLIHVFQDRPKRLSFRAFSLPLTGCPAGFPCNLQPRGTKASAASAKGDCWPSR